MEEHTLNLMPKAPSFYNFFCPSGLTYTHTHIYARTHKFTRALLLKHKTQNTGLLLKRNNDSVLGRKVIGLHGEPGKKSDVQCIYYA